MVSNVHHSAVYRDTSCQKGMTLSDVRCRFVSCKTTNTLTPQRLNRAPWESQVVPTFILQRKPDINTHSSKSQEAAKAELKECYNVSSKQKI